MSQHEAFQCKAWEVWGKRVGQKPWWSCGPKRHKTDKQQPVQRAWQRRHLLHVGPSHGSELPSGALWPSWTFSAPNLTAAPSTTVIKSQRGAVNVQDQRFPSDKKGQDPGPG